jgi:hypothetical protein
MKIVAMCVFSVVLLIGVTHVTIDQDVPVRLEPSTVEVSGPDTLRLRTKASGVWYINLNSSSGLPLSKRKLSVSTTIDGDTYEEWMSWNATARFFADKVKLSTEEWETVERFILKTVK